MSGCSRNFPGSSARALKLRNAAAGMAGTTEQSNTAPSTYQSEFFAIVPPSVLIRYDRAIRGCMLAGASLAAGEVRLRLPKAAARLPHPTLAPRDTQVQT